MQVKIHHNNGVELCIHSEARKQGYLLCKIERDEYIPCWSLVWDNSLSMVLVSSI